MQDLRSDIGEVVGRYRIGGTPTVFSHTSESQLVNFHEQTHNIDVSTTLFGYGLKRQVGLEDVNKGKWLSFKINSESEKWLRRSWGTFEGHATFNEFLYIALNHPESFEAWQAKLPDDYTGAFVKFFDLLYPHLQPCIQKFAADHTVFQILMFSQVIGNGLTAAIFDHAFATDFENVCSWSDIVDRMKKSNPDGFIKTHGDAVSEAIREPILELSESFGTLHFRPEATMDELKSDGDIVGRKIKSAIWHNVGGGMPYLCETGDFQLDLIEKIEGEIAAKHPDITIMNTRRGGTLIGEITTDLRKLPIERSVRIDNTETPQDVFDRISTALTAEDRFGVVLSALSGFGETGDQVLLGVHDLRLVRRKSITTIGFAAPILYAINQKPKFLRDLDDFFHSDDSPIKGRARVIWLGTYTGLDGEVGGLGYFHREEFMSFQGPKFIVVAQFSLDLFKRLSTIGTEPPSYEVWSIVEPPHRIDIAMARFSDFVVFWAGSGLLGKDIPTEGEKLTLGGIDFKVTDIQHDPNLSAAIFSYTHCYSSLVAMKLFEAE